MESSGTDVIVSFDDGGKYIATFFSLKGLKSMLDVEERSDKWIEGHYYKIFDLVVVKDFNKENLIHVIEAMEAEGDFQLVFKKL